YPFGMRVDNALVTYCVYIGQTLWPMNLGLFYPHPSDLLKLQATTGIASWHIVGAVLVLSAITFFVIAKGRAFPYLPVGWLWYLGTLMPVIGLVQVGSAARADRYTYIPLVGLFIVAVWGLGDLAKRWRIQRFAVGVGVLFLSISTIHCLGQLRFWANDFTLWEHTLTACGESTVAHTHLGVALLKRESFETAEQHFRRALQLAPNNPHALYNLGTALVGQGKMDEAVDQYREAVRRHPEFDRPHYSLGLALADTGRVHEALAEQEEALRLNPDLAAAHRSMGVLLS